MSRPWGIVALHLFASDAHAHIAELSLLRPRSECMALPVPLAKCSKSRAINCWTPSVWKSEKASKRRRKILLR
jgi:hypothetical protein